MNESPGVFYFMKKKLELIMSLCLLAAAFILAKQGAVPVSYTHLTLPTTPYV